MLMYRSRLRSYPDVGFHTLMLRLFFAVYIRKKIIGIGWGVYTIETVQQMQVQVQVQVQNLVVPPLL